MSTARTTDVLVVGAGPVGLTLALGLARAGVDCRIIERDPEFRDRGVRGKGVNPRTLEVFDDLGVVDEILARGDVNLKVRSYEGDRLVQKDLAATLRTTATMATIAALAGLLQREILPLKRLICARPIAWERWKSPRCAGSASA